MADNPPARDAAEHHDIAVVDDEGLADVRTRFLTSETVEPREVREPVLTSWWRSQQSRVPAARIEVPYFGDHDLDVPWVRDAQPLLHQLGQQFEGQPVSLIVTDRFGAVISQHTGDADLQRHLEGVNLEPGFSYGEQFVGTNGIGTALEDGQPRHVFGHEHYAEHLENLACAGVPIRHPLSGKVVGAVDLTCWRKDAGGLLITLARSTAAQVRQALLTTTSVHEMELFQCYLQACRRNGGITMALNGETVMMNDYARQLLEPADQSVLLGRASEALADTNRMSVTVALRSGTHARMHCRRVAASSGDTNVGVVVHVELLDTNERNGAGSAGPPMPTFVPGLVGQAPTWLRCCHEVDASCRAGEWLVLAGEPGVGKYVMARCVYRRQHPTARFEMLDAAQATNAGSVDDVARQLIDGTADGLVLRHVDRLGPSAASRLATTLHEVRSRCGESTPWIALTMSEAAETDPNLAELLALFPRTVHVPPLRYHLEDLRQLVPFFLNKLCHSGQLSCSPRAMQLLMRSDWSGNIAGLYGVLKHVTEHRRRTGEIQPNDLPAEYHAVARHPLNRLESAERDAIVHSLSEAGGDKVHAAEILGISRASIYRKIRNYGIVTPPQSR